MLLQKTLTAAKICACVICKNLTFSFVEIFFIPLFKNGGKHLQNCIFAVSFAGHAGGATRSPNPGSTSVSSSRAASGDTRLDCTVLENPIYVFPEMKLRGLIPISTIYVQVSVCDLYIPRTVCQFGCSKISRPILEIYKSLTDT